MRHTILFGAFCIVTIAAQGEKDGNLVQQLEDDSTSGSWGEEWMDGSLGEDWIEDPATDDGALAVLAACVDSKSAASAALDGCDGKTCPGGAQTLVDRVYRDCAGREMSNGWGDESVVAMMAHAELCKCGDGLAPGIDNNTDIPSAGNVTTAPIYPNVYMCFITLSLWHGRTKNLVQLYSYKGNLVQTRGNGAKGIP